MSNEYEYFFREQFRLLMLWLAKQLILAARATCTTASRRSTFSEVLFWIEDAQGIPFKTRVAKMHRRWR